MSLDLKELATKDELHQFSEKVNKTTKELSSVLSRHENEIIGIKRNVDEIKNDIKSMNNNIDQGLKNIDRRVGDLREYLIDTKEAHQRYNERINKEHREDIDEHIIRSNENQERNYKENTRVIQAMDEKIKDLAASVDVEGQRKRNLKQNILVSLTSIGVAIINILPLLFK